MMGLVLTGHKRVGDFGMRCKTIHGAVLARERTHVNRRRFSSSIVTQQRQDLSFEHLEVGSLDGGDSRSGTLGAEHLAQASHGDTLHHQEKAKRVKEAPWACVLNQLIRRCVQTRALLQAFEQRLPVHLFHCST